MDENNEQSLKVARRPGWEFTIPGEMLEPGSTRWTPEHYTEGVKVRCVFPTPDDEKRAVTEGVNENAGPAVTYISIRNAISEIDGVPVPFLERELVWKAFGSAGRTLAMEFWNRALTPSKEALEKARASFRLSV